MFVSPYVALLAKTLDTPALWCEKADLQTKRIHRLAKC